MEYDLELIDADGDVFPYCEKLDEHGYYYRISIILGDLDGELQIMNTGAHVEFDKGGWLDFKVPAPDEIFKGKTSLSQNDLLHFINLLLNENVETRYYRPNEVQQFKDLFNA